jgi:hypothetical protein
MLRTIKIPKKIPKVLVHGMIIVLTLVIIQMLLDAYQNSYMLFLPPIGFAIFIVVSYVIQPIVVGIVNVIILSKLYDFESCRIGFWLNGLFLLLTFSTINLLLQTVWNLPFSALVAVIEVATLSIPFGYLGKFSNTGQKQQQKTERDQPQLKTVAEEPSNSKQA